MHLTSLRICLIESVSDDTREIARLWQVFSKYLSDPRNVLDDLWLSPEEGREGEGAVKVQGSSLDPTLADVFFVITPDTRGSDRFFNVQGHDDTIHDQKELRLALSDIVPKSDPVFKLWNDYAYHDDRTNAARVASSISRIFKAIQHPPSTFSHEILHVLQARKMGGDVMQKLYQGPSDATTRKRMRRRTNKLQGYDPNVKGPRAADVTFSKKGPESYAVLDNELMVARRLLDADPHAFPKPIDLVAQAIAGGRRYNKSTSLEKLRKSYDPTTWKRLVKMLTKMWQEAQGS